MPVNLGPLKDDSYWISSTEKAYDSPYYKLGYEYVDSPYYANPFYRRIINVGKPSYREELDELWDAIEPKQELWSCRYCGSTNLPDITKCDSCNAPRRIKKEVEQASVWGMNLLDVIPKGEPWYQDTVDAQFQSRFNKLEQEVSSFNIALGKIFIAPFEKIVERFTSLWNGLKSVS